MRTVSGVLLLLALCGCQPASRHDPYLDAIGRYNSSLDAAKTNGQPVGPPPKPVYLPCPVQPQPLPEPAETPGGPTGETMSRTAQLPSISTVSQSDCERINSARKQAYEDALRQYEQITGQRSTD
jgi:hypothetical protein